jgi:hypothetical protein
MADPLIIGCPDETTAETAATEVSKLPDLPARSRASRRCGNRRDTIVVIATVRIDAVGDRR